MDLAKIDQKLIIENKKSLSLNGVENVAGFSEDCVFLDTSLGRVTIEGREMKIESLQKGEGLISITGEITGVYYTDQMQRKGVIKRWLK